MRFEPTVVDTNVGKKLCFHEWNKGAILPLLSYGNVGKDTVGEHGIAVVVRKCLKCGYVQAYHARAKDMLHWMPTYLVRMAQREGA